jgi:DNA-binding transcriptional LysR family regulator
MAIFAKVGELGSMSAAARPLGLPKSTVSRAVARLEQGYGARLVERTTRRLTLTEIGRSFHGHCLAMMAELDNAEAEIAAYQGHPSGLLRIAAPHSIGRYVIGPNIPEFLARYADVDIHLQLTDQILSPGTSGLDVVLRIGALEDSSAIARKITDVNAVLVASAAYVERHGLPRSIEELAGHVLIGLPVLGGEAIDLVSGRERVKVPTSRRFACNDPILNLELVRKGLAIAPVSSFFLASALETGALVRVLPGWSLAAQPAVYALYASRTAISPKITAFLDFLTELAARLKSDPAGLSGL